MLRVTCLESTLLPFLLLRKRSCSLPLILSLRYLVEGAGAGAGAGEGEGEGAGEGEGWGEGEGERSLRHLSEAVAVTELAGCTWKSIPRGRGTQVPFLVTPPERFCSGTTSAEALPIVLTFSSACAASSFALKRGTTSCTSCARKLTVLLKMGRDHFSTSAEASLLLLSVSLRCIESSLMYTPILLERSAPMSVSSAWLGFGLGLG